MRRILALSALALACVGESSDPVVVGSKNFTESVILGEMLAQTIEAAGCQVDRKLNMGGTFVLDRAIRSGDLDAYVEYSGTALTAILDENLDGAESRPEEVRRRVAEAYDRSGLVWGADLGFENTFAMIVRRNDSERFGLASIGDLAKVQDRFQPGFGYEFAERADGWRGLLDAYGLEFAKPPRTMDLGLTYRALAENSLDLIAGNSTDGLIEHLGLVALRDDRSWFPPYDAVVVHRSDLSTKCPAAVPALDALEGSVGEDQMRRLNYAVDGEKRDVVTVVREYLGVN